MSFVVLKYSLNTTTTHHDFISFTFDVSARDFSWNKGILTLGGKLVKIRAAPIIQI